MNRYYIDNKEFEKVWSADINDYDKLELIADMNRINTLTCVRVAGSGHLGSSLSAMDIVVWLYYKEMNTVAKGLSDTNRDIYFSSKGHDVPGLHSVFYSLGIIDADKLFSLRRLNGLNGHPDISDVGIEVNSGSLGMGISKARGIAWAKNYLGHNGRVIVMTGDGEFQEGQNYEALQGAMTVSGGKVIVIMDHNKYQTDKPVDEIVPLADLGKKIKSFGWYVFRCDGHNFNELDRCFRDIDAKDLTRAFIIADTVKGKGISFMEHTNYSNSSNTLYPWHSGAPEETKYLIGLKELRDKIEKRYFEFGLKAFEMSEVKHNGNITEKYLVGEQLSEEEIKIQSGVSDEYLANSFGECLVEHGKNNKNLIVLDADLSADCRLREFEKLFPERFIEIGIAEQDMVSVAGGLARQGLLPVVNTFGAFLASRANEQIYNNSGENSRIIYICHYSGLIPAGPGKSHQSLRDISLFSSLQNFDILQPSSGAEVKLAMEYAINTSQNNCMIRLPIGPSPQKINLPDKYIFEPGKGVELIDGKDAVLFAYGPVMLNEAILAAGWLRRKGISLKVVNMPWLNKLDVEWMAEVVGKVPNIFVLEDHHTRGGLGDFLIAKATITGIVGKKYQILGIEGFPACGTPPEVLKFHRVDSHSLAERIEEAL